MAALSIGVYTLVNRTLVESNIDTMTEMPQLVEKLSEYDGDFVLRQDDDFRETAEAKKEYLVFGKCISDIQIDGHTYSYLIRRVKISELDNKLRLESFGGEGMASVIDQDGNYIIKLNRTGSVAERDNFLEKLQTAEFYGGLTYEEVMKTVQEDPDGISFEAKYDGTRYVVHIAALENTDWYYASLVPVSVFSAVTNRIRVWYLS